MKTKLATDVAVAWAAGQRGLKDAVVVSRTEAVEPGTGRLVQRLSLVSEADPNGATHTVLVGDDGHVLAATPALKALFTPAEASPGPASIVPAPPITISPIANNWVLYPADVVSETLTVTVPRIPMVPIDVYVLTDTTGSMGDILSAVKAGAVGMFGALDSLHLDLAYGVGDYKDFLAGDPYAFANLLAPTASSADAITAINSMNASGGGDTAEAALFALDRLAEAPGGAIGWRAGSERIIVWIGDAPSHDPICAAVSGLPDDITEMSVTGKLVAQGIHVMAVSVGAPGLDDDPRSSGGYAGACGAPGGTAGQASRIADATGGALISGVSSDTIVEAITRLITKSLGTIRNLKVVPTASIAPFITSIEPAAGYGPVNRNLDSEWRFEVVFHGIAATEVEQIFDGRFEVLADGVAVAAKPVHIVVPALDYVYSVKFLCGAQAACDCACTTVRPGRYATDINLHNPYDEAVTVSTRFVLLTLAGAPIGRDPRASSAGSIQRISVPAHGATMDDCCRITERSIGVPGTSADSLNTGFMEIRSPRNLVVTAVYTASGGKGDGVAIDVVQVTARRG